MRGGARGEARGGAHGGVRGDTGGGARLRPLDAPCPVQVRTGGDGTPAEVRLGHGPLRVLSIRERWRIDDEWWRTPIHRIYHQVVLEDGRVSTLYRDLVDGGWYLHGRGAVAAPAARRGTFRRGGAMKGSGETGRPRERGLSPPRTRPDLPGRPESGGHRIPP
ncbi:MAG: hypothetical protein JSU98_00505 [Gemmatimonadales bacterium]|nr:MAG: hypothetical protein JSU98_00505 [Gemmatimonadales bacterium]